MQPVPPQQANDLAAHMRGGPPEDAAAFEVVYTTYYESAVRIAYSVVKSRDAAKDIAHDVFIKIWEQRSSLRENHLSKAYILASTYNRALDELKKVKVRERYSELLKTDETSDAGGSEGISQTNFESVMASLSERQALAVRLRFQEQLEIPEIATALGLSPNATYQLIHRAVKELRRVLKPS